MKCKQIGEKYWFEYHCSESEQSCDAEIWHHTHQKVKILKLVEKGYGCNPKERGEKYGQPAVYNVCSDDGFKFDVFEDELMTSKKNFYRPDYKK